MPDITIHLQTPDGKNVAQLSTGEVLRVTSPKWTQYQFLFTTPPSATTLNLIMVNSAPGGCGNDFAMDDITFRECVIPPPVTEKKKTNTVAKKQSITVNKPTLKSTNKPAPKITNKQETQPRNNPQTKTTNPPAPKQVNKKALPKPDTSNQITKSPKVIAPQVKQQTIVFSTAS